MEGEGPQRGGGASAAGNEPIKAADAGTGFLMGRGYTVVWSGWQGDLRAGGGGEPKRRKSHRRPDGPAELSQRGLEGIGRHARALGESVHRLLPWAGVARPEKSRVGL